MSPHKTMKPLENVQHFN